MQIAFALLLGSLSLSFGGGTQVDVQKLRSVKVGETGPDGGIHILINYNSDRFLCIAHKTNPFLHGIVISQLALDRSLDKLPTVALSYEKYKFATSYNEYQNGETKFGLEDISLDSKHTSILLFYPAKKSEVLGEEGEIVLTLKNTRVDFTSVTGFIVEAFVPSDEIGAKQKRSTRLLAVYQESLNGFLFTPGLTEITSGSNKYDVMLDNRTYEIDVEEGKIDKSGQRSYRKFKEAWVQKKELRKNYASTHFLFTPKPL